MKAATALAEAPVSSPGAALKAGRKRLGLSVRAADQGSGVREIYIYGLEANRDTMPDVFARYSAFLARGLGDAWAAEMAAAVFDSMAAKARSRGKGLEQLRLSERAYHGFAMALDKSAKRSSPVKGSATLTEMAQDGATVGSEVRRPRSSGERAAVKVPRLQSVSERIQAAWGMKPLTLDGLAA